MIGMFGKSKNWVIVNSNIPNLKFNLYEKQIYILLYTLLDWKYEKKSIQNNLSFS